MVASADHQKSCATDGCNMLKPTKKTMGLTQKKTTPFSTGAGKAFHQQVLGYVGMVMFKDKRNIYIYTIHYLYIT